MILKSDGILWATGRNHYGQLGDGTNIDKNSPVQIMSNVSSISAGTDHTMILKSDGTLWATGSNLFDELGDGGSGHKNRPVYIMNGISSVFGGMCNTLIIKTDGTLWAVGRNFGDSFSIIPPLAVLGPALVCLLTIFSFSTMALSFLGIIFKTVPIFPFSLPAITITLSFFLM